ncbi:hypothetical protein GQR58_008205 [Nymphon striatum]|nr:hypothetical protein GQR58_008205 [Nymphon striatum]
MKAFHPGIFIVSFGTSFSALAPVSRLKCTSPFKLISPKSICLRQSVLHGRRHRRFHFRFHFRFHRFHFHNLVFVSFLKLVEFAIPKESGDCICTIHCMLSETAIMKGSVLMYFSRAVSD